MSYNDPIQTPITGRENSDDEREVLKHLRNFTVPSTPATWN
jgi:hypothetical protein